MSKPKKPKRKDKKRSGQAKRSAYASAKATPQHNVKAQIKPKPQPAPELEPGEEWHAVYTNIKCERRAAWGLKAKGFTVYLPEYDTTTTVARKVVPVTRPYLPRYIFVAFKPAKKDSETGHVDGGQWWAIRSTDGVEAVICDPATLRPIRIPRRQIEALADSVGKAAAVAQEPPFPVGSMVAIAEGPFASYAGPVVDSGPDGVEVLVELLGKATHLHLPLPMVRAA